MASQSQANAAVQLYDSRSHNYDNSWHSSFTQRFASQLDLQPGQHVLDLACGTGLLTFLEADAVGPSGSVIGIDITPGMLAQAKGKRETGGNKYAHTEFHQGDILDLDSNEALKGKEASFDAITVSSALVLFPNPVVAIRYWMKYLKIGGIIAVDSTHPRNLISGIILERVGKKLGVPIPYHRDWSQSEDSLRQVLEAAGMQVVQTMTIEDQAGYGTRKYNIDEADDKFVSTAILGFAGARFRAPDIRDKARALWMEEWEKLAVHGKVEEVDSVFLGIARKVSSEPSDQPDKVNDETVFSGGCRCGKVKYTSTTVPSSITICHCRACQQLSGSGYLPFVEIPTASLHFQAQSTLQTIRLSEIAKRTLCSSCGTPISMVYFLDGGEKDTSLTVGSVDVSSYKDEFPKVKQHIFLKEKAPWVVLPEDGASRYEIICESAGYFEHFNKTN